MYTEDEEQLVIRDKRTPDILATCAEVILNSELSVGAHDLYEKRLALLRLLGEMQSGTPLTEAELTFL